MTAESAKRAVIAHVDEHRESLLELSHALHADPETSFREVRSVERVSAALSEDFATEMRVANLPTAFRSTTGNGDLNIAICAEYDALPGVGHACGHNIVAAAAVGAANALARVGSEMNLRVTVLGTPAEEGGGGKILMLQRGAFDGVHAAVMAHPAAIERDAMRTLAVGQMNIGFTGRSAHAAAAPQRGRNAASAMALAQSGIAMLREHLEASDRVHGIVTHGGDAFNVVPGRTTGKWAVRAGSLERQRVLEQRVRNVFRGAALMTGCELRIDKVAPTFSEVITNEDIAAHWRSNAASLGRQSLPIQADDGPASTDMGNVSHAVPSIHPLLAIDAEGSNIHEARFEEFAGLATGDLAVLDGAKLLAMTIVDVATDDALRTLLRPAPFAVSRVDHDAPYLDNTWNQTEEFDPSSTR